MVLINERDKRKMFKKVYSRGFNNRPVHSLAFVPGSQLNGSGFVDVAVGKAKTLGKSLLNGKIFHDIANSKTGRFVQNIPQMVPQVANVVANETQKMIGNVINRTNGLQGRGRGNQISGAGLNILQNMRKPLRN